MPAASFLQLAPWKKRSQLLEASLTSQRARSSTLVFAVPENSGQLCFCGKTVKEKGRARKRAQRVGVDASCLGAILYRVAGTHSDCLSKGFVCKGDVSTSLMTSAVSRDFRLLV